MEELLNNKYLTYKLNNETYAINIKDVIEIVGIEDTTSIPDLPDYFNGIINLRGKIIPILDMHKRVHGIQKQYDESSSIIVMRIKETMVGALVDRVLEVIDIDDEFITPPPLFSSHGKLLMGVGLIDDKLHLIVDVEHIISDRIYQEIVEVH